MNTGAKAKTLKGLCSRWSQFLETSYSINLNSHLARKGFSETTTPFPRQTFQGGLKRVKESLSLPQAHAGTAMGFKKGYDHFFIGRKTPVPRIGANHFLRRSFSGDHGTHPQQRLILGAIREIQRKGRLKRCPQGQSSEAGGKDGTITMHSLKESTPSSNFRRERENPLRERN